MRNRKRSFRWVLTVLAGIFSLCFAALFVWMLPSLGTTIGTASSEKARERTSLNFTESYERRVNNLSATAMSGIIAIPKHYQLPEDTVIAPAPDPANFGRSADPADTVPIRARAEELLGGQRTIWSPDIEIRKDSDVLWYLDDTILSITWKQSIENSVFTFTEVKIAHPSQFRRYLADNTFASPVQYRPTELAQTVNAVSAMSADFYKFRKYGIIVYQRELYRAEGRLVDSCFVDSGGNLLFAYRGELTTEEEIRRFVEDNDVVFSMAFGPVLIDNGKNVLPGSYPVGEINDHYARAAIAQLGDCHYLLATINHEALYGPITGKAEKMARVLSDLGVDKAYTLDGGQTASMIVNGELINSVEFGYQRAVSDIIFFATAIPERQQWEAEHG